ncbi:hypothetical protein CG740_13065 [Streptomyces sp. CB01201]|nr:hypothetical protein CG740_13065 [Streptomyces sp. CB01201]
MRQVFDLVRHSGVLERLPSNEHRPGPKGFPFRTVLIGLILSQYMGKSANINDAWETLFFALSPGSKALLWGKEPDYHQDRASLEITAGMYVKRGTQKKQKKAGPSGKPAASTNTGTRRGTANKPPPRKTKSKQEKRAKAPEKREFRYAMPTSPTPTPRSASA